MSGEEEAEALAALTGRKMNDLVSEGPRQVLHPIKDESVPQGISSSASVVELQEWFKAADQAIKKAPPGPSAREMLEQGRSRLEAV